MKKLTTEQVAKLKRRATHYERSTISVNQWGELETRASNLDKRIVEGYAVIWGVRNSWGETFVKGAFAKSIRERGPGSGAKYEIKMLWQHDQRDPLSLFEVIKEDDVGLYFRTKPLDDVESANRLLIQLRSGTINNFSVGWDFVWDKLEYDDITDTVIVMEAELYEISPVTIPADMETFAMRGKEVLEDLHDETESFINGLKIPRNDKIELKQLFARHKALIPLEAETEQTVPITSKSTEPPALNYELCGQLFNNNFKL